VRWPIDRREADDPHAKAGLLLQAHLGRGTLPVSDYITDTRSVLDNSLRILQVRAWCVPDLHPHCAATGA
jgi:activating signal cointegrator complex subunit 3